MTMALDLAKKGCGFTSPNPMVGAVVVRNGRVVGKGYHEIVGGFHAEVNAIDDARGQAVGATLYVTLEPCNHTGRTPPCTEKIISSGIRRVVTAMEDPNPAVTGGGNRYLKQMGVEVLVGVCEEEAKHLNAAFIKHVRTRRPFVVLKSAATLDGRIAAATGDARWVTNALSRHYVHRLRHAVDAVMVGIGTVKADNPSLTTRLPGLVNGRKWRDPVRIILDSRLSIDPEAVVLTQRSSSPTLLVTGDLTGVPGLMEKKEALLNKGAQFLQAPVKDGRIDLSALMDRLGAMDITSLLIEGGAAVAGSALADNIVDRVMMFFASKLYGGDNGVPITRGTGPALMAHSTHLKNIEVKRFGDDVMIKGDIEEEAPGDKG